MKSMTLFSAAALTAALSLSGCRCHKQPEAMPCMEPEQIPITIRQPDRRVPTPPARIYRTNGDYTDNVPVQLNEAGDALVSFPAPSDLTPNQRPIPLADGYLLDRRGVGLNTVFTRYTYTEYAKLKEVPSPRELMDAIIPGSRVISVRTLPITPSQAAADTAAVNRFIRTGTI